MRQLMIACVSSFFVTAAAGAAFACSIAEPWPILQGLGSETEPTAAESGRIILNVLNHDQSEADGLTVVIVTSATGEELAGVLEYGADGLAQWVPDAPLAAGVHQVTATVAGVDEIGFVMVSEDASAPSIGVDALDWRQRPGDAKNCCDVAQRPECQYDTCGGSDGCSTCWSLEYVYEPSVTIASQNPGAFVQRVTVTHGHTTNVDVQLGSQLNPRTIVGDVDSDDPVCVTVEFLDAHGSELHPPSEECIELADFPALERQEIDNDERVAGCVAEPADPTDPAWQKRLNEDPDAPGSTLAKDGGGGCSTASGVGTGPLVLLLAVVGAGRRRRTVGRS